MQAARGASLNPSDQADPSTSVRRVDRRIVFAVVGLLAYAVDLGTKQWALAVLPDGDISVIDDLFTLHLTFNPGAAFSTGTQFTIVFTALSFVAVCVVLWLSRRLGSTGWALGLGFLLAGAGGNLTDRLFRAPEPLRGHVVDLLMLPNWPVFNFADVFINVAAGVIILQTFRGVRIDGTRESEHESDREPRDADDVVRGPAQDSGTA